MYKVLIDVFGIKTRLLTTIPEFVDFVKKNYYHFIQCELRSHDIQVNFSVSAGQNAEKIKRAMLPVEKGIYLGNERIYWENEFGFRILLECQSKDKWRLDAFHNDLLRKECTKSEKYENFQRSMRWILHFPIFVLLQLKQGKSVLHASAVAKNGQAVVLCGFNKVGKSTLSAYLSREKGYKFMTDNFLFFDSDRFYGFPERIRMDSVSIKALDIQNRNNIEIYGKYHIDTEPQKVCLSAKPNSLFFISRGDNFKISKLDSIRADLLINGMNNYLQEFPEYSYLAFLPFLGIHYKGNPRNIRRILKMSNCFCLTHRADWRLSETAQEMERCI